MSLHREIYYMPNATFIGLVHKKSAPKDIKLLSKVCNRLKGAIGSFIDQSAFVGGKTET